MQDKLDELIKKLYTELHYPIADGVNRGVFYKQDIDKFIEDLKSLQPEQDELIRCPRCGIFIGDPFGGVELELIKDGKSEQEVEECVHGSQKHYGDKHTCLTCGADLYWDNESNKYRPKFHKDGISEQEVENINIKYVEGNA